MDGINMITADSAVEDLVEFVRGADIDLLALLYSQHCQRKDGEPVLVECEGEYSAPHQAGIRMRISFVPA
jgi:hypothetical protein